MSRFTKEWAKDAGERVVSSAVEAFAASGAVALAAAPAADLSTWRGIGYSAAVAGLAAGLTTVKAVFAAFRDRGTPAGLVDLRS